MSEEMLKNIPLTQLGEGRVGKETEYISITQNRYHPHTSQFS